MVGDKVIQGVTASFVPKGGFAVALDVESGKEAWRFNTIARPGEPNGDSWNDVPLEKRSGGSIWHELSYDPELDLVYFGIAPTYDTGPLLHPAANTAVNSNALYTNCTVAIRPKTGELAWYYQHVANDQWDLDWVFERTIVNVPWNGKTRKAVMNVGKMGILEALDAATGEYLFSVDPGIQNVITAIDPKTGAKTIDPGKLPDPKRPTDVCPSAIGARSWPPTSYSPKTQLAYLPLTESCMRLGPAGVPIAHLRRRHLGSDSPGDRRRQERTPAGDRRREQEAGVDARPGQRSDHRPAGDRGRRAFRGRPRSFAQGVRRHHRRASCGRPSSTTPPSSGLVTYRVKDKQYVAVVVGMHNFHVDGLARSIDGLLAGDAASAAVVRRQAPPAARRRGCRRRIAPRPGDRRQEGWSRHLGVRLVSRI